jgi:hypothetical protein
MAVAAGTEDNCKVQTGETGALARLFFDRENTAASRGSHLENNACAM